MFQIFAHANLSHQFIFVTVHTGQLSNLIEKKEQKSVSTWRATTTTILQQYCNILQQYCNMQHQPTNTNNNNNNQQQLTTTQPKLVQKTHHHHHHPTKHTYVSKDVLQSIGQLVRTDVAQAVLHMTVDNQFGQS